MTAPVLSQSQGFASPGERAKKRPVDDAVVGEDLARPTMFTEPTKNIFGHAAVDDQPSELQLIKVGPGHGLDGDEDGNDERDRGFDHASRVVQRVCQPMSTPRYSEQRASPYIWCKAPVTGL